LPLNIMNATRWCSQMAVQTTKPLPFQSIN
jgi:hypothetical protein